MSTEDTEDIETLLRRELDAISDTEELDLDELSLEPLNTLQLVADALNNADLALKAEGSLSKYLQFLEEDVTLFEDLKVVDVSEETDPVFLGGPLLSDGGSPESGGLNEEETHFEHVGHDDINSKVISSLANDILKKQQLIDEGIVDDYTSLMSEFVPDYDAILQKINDDMSAAMEITSEGVDTTAVLVEGEGDDRSVPFGFENNMVGLSSSISSGISDSINPPSTNILEELKGIDQNRENLGQLNIEGLTISDSSIDLQDYNMVDDTDSYVLPSFEIDLVELEMEWSNSAVSDDMKVVSESDVTIELSGLHAVPAVSGLSHSIIESNEATQALEQLDAEIASLRAELAEKSDAAQASRDATLALEKDSERAQVRAASAIKIQTLLRGFLTRMKVNIKEMLFKESEKRRQLELQLKRKEAARVAAAALATQRAERVAREQAEAQRLRQEREERLIRAEEAREKRRQEAESRFLLKLKESALQREKQLQERAIALAELQRQREELAAAAVEDARSRRVNRQLRALEREKAETTSMMNEDYLFSARVAQRRTLMNREYAERARICKEIQMESIQSMQREEILSQRVNRLYRCVELLRRRAAACLRSSLVSNDSSREKSFEMDVEQNFVLDSLSGKVTLERLQALFRGHLVRSGILGAPVRQLRADRARQLARRRNGAALRIQSYWRGHRLRRRLAGALEGLADDPLMAELEAVDLSSFFSGISLGLSVDFDPISEIYDFGSSAGAGKLIEMEAPPETEKLLSKRGDNEALRARLQSTISLAAEEEQRRIERLLAEDSMRTQEEEKKAQMDQLVTKESVLKLKADVAALKKEILEFTSLPVEEQSAQPGKLSQLTMRLSELKSAETAAVITYRQQQTQRQMLRASQPRSTDLTIDDSSIVTAASARRVSRSSAGIRKDSVSSIGSALSFSSTPSADFDDLGRPRTSAADRSVEDRFSSIEHLLNSAAPPFSSTLHGGIPRTPSRKSVAEDETAISSTEKLWRSRHSGLSRSPKRLPVNVSGSLPHTASVGDIDALHPPSHPQRSASARSEPSEDSFEASYMKRGSGNGGRVGNRIRGAITKSRTSSTGLSVVQDNLPESLQPSWISTARPPSSSRGAVRGRSGALRGRRAQIHLNAVASINLSADIRNDQSSFKRYSSVTSRGSAGSISSTKD